MEHLIELQEIYKIYQQGEQEIRALDGMSLRVDAGDFVAIVGQSGSGKSTLMNILGCLDTPTSGRYILNDLDVSQLDDNQLSFIRNRNIGFIFQGFNLIPSLDAVENVELPLIYRGVSRAARRKVALDCLNQVGLGGRLHHRPAQMSGGQQQRVAIARAIAAKPAIILADEPTGNLDSRSGEEVMNTLETLNQGGHTIVLITHDPTVAQRAGREIHIHDGKIIKERHGKGA